jgi:hypothetical protein
MTNVGISRQLPVLAGADTSQSSVLNAILELSCLESVLMTSA